MSFELKGVWCSKIFQKTSKILKNLFIKLKMFIWKYTIFILTFKGPRKFISWTSRKTQMTIFALVQNIVQTPMEALPLLVINLFSQDVLDCISKMC